MRSGVFASFHLGAGGARQRVDGAPRPPGSVLSGRTPGASANTDSCSGGPRVRFPVSRVLISWKGGTPGCGVRADRARGSGTQAHPVEGRGRARNRHVRRRDPAPHRIGEGGFDCRGCRGVFTWQRPALLGGPIAVSAGAITASESVTVGFLIGVRLSGHHAK